MVLVFVSSLDFNLRNHSIADKITNFDFFLMNRNVHQFVQFCTKIYRSASQIGNMKKKMFLENWLHFCLVGKTPFQKYPNFLKICSIFNKNLPNFASPNLKLHNQYSHDNDLSQLRALAYGCGRVSTADPKPGGRPTSYLAVDIKLS